MDETLDNDNYPDFAKELIDKEVEIECKVSTISRYETLGQRKMLLKDVKVNGEFFRDHCFIPYSKKFKAIDIKKKDRFTAIATLYLYPNPDTNKRDKIGIKSIKYITILPKTPK